MAECKECLYYDVCVDFRRNICETDKRRFEEYKINSNGICDHFKNKSDYTEVKRGEWKEMYPDEYEIVATEFVCSICRETFCTGEMTDEEFLSTMKYCPNCGADMRRGEK